MGDMADELFDSIFNADLDPDDEEQDVCCKYCGKDGLWWQDVGDKRVLFEAVGRHSSIRQHNCNRGLTKKDIINSFSDID